MNPVFPFSLKLIEAVIFDFDGTLYDFKGLPQKLILGKLTHLFKIKAERNARKTFKGIDFQNALSWEEAFAKELSKHSNWSESKALNWYKTFYCLYMVKILQKHFRMRESANEIIQILKNADVKRVIFSDYPMVEERLKAIGGNVNDFNLLVSSESFGALKPAPRPFLEISAKLNISPENILVIGDRNDTDGLGAESAKMKFIQTESHKTKGDKTVISWVELKKEFEMEFLNSKVD
jgi:FMN phosphatase YigB (HAD superfamily)